VPVVLVEIDINRFLRTEIVSLIVTDIVFGRFFIILTEEVEEFDIIFSILLTIFILLLTTVRIIFPILPLTTLTDEVELNTKVFSLLIASLSVTVEADITEITFPGTFLRVIAAGDAVIVMVNVRKRPVEAATTELTLMVLKYPSRSLGCIVEAKDRILPIRKFPNETALLAVTVIIITIGFLS